MQEEIIKFYSRPQFGGGSGVVFSGSRRQQVGGGFFGSLARFALPMLKTIGSRVLNVASRTASDVLQEGRPLKQSLLDNTVEEVQSILRKRAAPTTHVSPSSINNSGELEGRGYFESDVFNNNNNNSIIKRPRLRKKKKKKKQTRYYAAPLRKKRTLPI
jgi:hypothetical protein